MTIFRIWNGNASAVIDADDVGMAIETFFELHPEEKLNEIFSKPIDVKKAKSRRNPAMYPIVKGSLP